MVLQVPEPLLGGELRVAVAPVPETDALFNPPAGVVEVDPLSLRPLGWRRHDSTREPSRAKEQIRLESRAEVQIRLESRAEEQIRLESRAEEQSRLESRAEEQPRSEKRDHRS